MDKKLIKFRNNVLGDVSSRQYLKTPYLVFAISILLTVGVTYFFYMSVDEKDRARFDADVAKIELTINNRINNYITLLKSSRGFLEANRATSAVNKQSFSVFIRSVELQEQFGGAQGVGFIKPLKPEEHAAWTERMKAEGHKDFAIFSAGGAGLTDRVSYVISYLEPIDKDTNSRGIGYAISSEAQKLAAIEKAIDSGSPTISERVFLIQEPRDPNSITRPGFQLFVPIYRTDTIPDTVEKRRQELDGLVYCPFRAENFVAEVHKQSGVSDISFEIYDKEATPENLLGASDNSNKSPAKSAENNSLPQSVSHALYSSIRFDETKSIVVGDEKWVIKYQSLPKFHLNSSTSWTLIIFFFGLGISLVLFFITLSQSKAHASLEQVAEELARSEKVKDEFISVVSHELRTPLNSIAGGVTILRNPRINDETRAKALSIIDKNLRSQVSLVEDMIVFSDINAGKEYLQLKPLNFSTIVDRVFMNYSSQAQMKNIALTKHGQFQNPLVAGDEGKLEKVLQNIITNSLKFTQPGGEIALLLDTTPAGHIQLKIRDDGFGIHPQVLPHVFDLFTQGDSSTVRRHGGLGLGLTLSHNIIKMHGGTLEAESPGLNKGSTFIITLPTVEAQ